jgi:hypothetical protein
MVKEDEKVLKKRKSTPEPKVAASKKRKAEIPEPKVTEVEEETPSTPPTAKVAEILKVVTESLPIKLLSPLGPELAKFLQKKDKPSATKKADGQKKRRIVTVMQAIERTPPSASASKITHIASVEATAEANASAEAAAAAKPPTLRVHFLELINCSWIWLRKRQLRLQRRSWPQCLTKERRLPMLHRRKKTSNFGTWSGKNYPRPKRRSYRSMVYHVATSQEPCSLVGSMKGP